MRVWLSLVWLGVALFGAAGCAVDQRAEVAKYRSILDVDADGPVDRLDRDEPLTLMRALALANQDNERLAISGEDFVQAWAEKDRAFGAFLPTITLAPGYTITDNSAASNNANGLGRPVGTSGSFKAVGTTLRRFEAPVNGSVNLFRGFTDLASLEAADWTMEQRRQLLLDAQATLLLDVAQAFYTVLRSESNVDVLTRSLASQQERVRDARARVRAGIGTSLDMDQAEAQAAGTRATLVAARGDVANGRTLLAFLIGATEVGGPLRDQFDLPGVAMAVDELLGAAWENREDYKAAAAARHGAVYDVEAAWGQYYPSVTLNVTGYLFRENFSDASKWNSLLSVSLPIFSAGVIEADVKAAWSRLRQAAMRESLLRRQIEDEVRERHQNFQTSAGRLTELEIQVRAAQSAYTQARGLYGAGASIFLNVLTAQAVLLNSELELTTERFNQKVIYLDLLRSTGRLKLGAMRQAAASPTTGPTTRMVATPATVPATQPATGVSP
jgi:outer membrane protein